MGPFGIWELVVIFAVALIIFGPRKLPELGKSLGKSLSEFKRASNELRSTLDDEIRSEDRRAANAPPAKASATTAATPGPDVDSVTTPSELIDPDSPDLEDETSEPADPRPAETVARESRA